MARYEPTPLVMPVRTPVPTDDRNVVEMAERFGSEKAFRLAIRSWDATMPEAGQQAVWAAQQTPMSAEDAAAEHKGLTATWVSNQLARRSAYFAKIAAMLKLTTRQAAGLIAGDLQLVPDRGGSALQSSIDPRIREAVRSAVRESVADIKASKSERADARSARRRR
jgi:hypothetical protein